MIKLNSNEEMLKARTTDKLIENEIEELKLNFRIQNLKNIIN